MCGRNLSRLMPSCDQLGELGAEQFHSTIGVGKKTHLQVKVMPPLCVFAMDQEASGRPKRNFAFELVGIGREWIVSGRVHHNRRQRREVAVDR
ncbi:hypothetical protein AWB97_18105 [Mycobacterium intracellulare subsp. chimaera]|nr:hypothetical protein AWB97_18105 [Mycobacterium intracellulare subsp. chimaera]